MTAAPDPADPVDPDAPVDPADVVAVSAQLGRPARGVHRVAHRCRCGLPDVVETEPRLPDGTPFPTTFYLTCPRLAAEIGRLEASGLMREWTERLAADPDLAAGYRRAHEHYLAARERLGHVPEIAGISAGGMPDRVKCLHSLVGHALAAGPGVNPLGDEALALLPDWAAGGRCVEVGPPVRVAAVDCGTNSIRLLVADITTEQATGTRHLHELDRRLEIVRLGEGVDRTGRLSEQALARTFAACERYAERIRELGADQVRFVATSASRDADNRAEFVTGIREILGVEPEVITGAEEADLSFAGATRELAGRRIPTPYLVVDIGGGSTEFVLGGARPEAAVSVDMGCVRLTERYLTDDPPTPEQVERARAEVERRLDEVAGEVPLERARTLVGLAGTVTTVAATAMDLPAYDRDRIHHARIGAADVHAAAGRLLTMTHAERKALPFMHPGRVDVIGAGALILDRILARVSPHLARTELVVSEHDILDGIAWSGAERSSRPAR